MKRFIVRYDYQLPGWDEYGGKTREVAITLEADSREGALARFKELEEANANNDRTLKFCFPPHSIEEV